MTANKDEVLGLLRNWRTPGELKSRLGIPNPEACLTQLLNEGYGIKKEKREVGMFHVLCYRWDGTRKMVRQ